MFHRNRKNISLHFAADHQAGIMANTTGAAHVVRDLREKWMRQSSLACLGGDGREWRWDNSLEALEARIMLDAAGAVTGAELAHEDTAQEQLDAHLGAAIDDPSAPAVGEEGEETLARAMEEPAPVASDIIVFIDKSVGDIETHLRDIGDTAEVVLLDPDTDGVEQIAAVLADRRDISAIHILSHGRTGELYLGSATLDVASMQGAYHDELTTIGDALGEDGDILIYGCNFGQGEAGLEAATVLGAITRADVAASQDITGAASLGGDWQLETSVGAIEATALAAESWQGALVDTDGDSVDDTIDIDDDNDGILDIDEGAVQTVVPGSTMAFEKSDVDPSTPNFDTAVDGTSEYANAVEYIGAWDVTGTVDWSEGQYILESDPSANVDFKAMIEPSSPAGGGFAIFSVPGEGLVNTMTVSVGEIYTVEFYVGILPQYADSDPVSTGTLTAYAPDFTYGITSGGQAVGGGSVSFDQSDLANQYTSADFPDNINPVSPATFVELDPNWQKVSFTFEATATTAILNITTNAHTAAILVDGFSTTQISSVTGIDSDQDGIFDHLDIDSDNDGITDNVEAQATATYIAPSGTGGAMTDVDGDGLDDNYDADTGDTTPAASVGLTRVDTDGDGTPDTLDPDSDNDSVNDVDEAGHGVTQATINASPDTDGDGLKDAVEGTSNNDGFDVNDNNLDGTNTNFLLADSDNDTAADGSDAAPMAQDLDYRDNAAALNIAPALDLDGDDSSLATGANYNTSFTAGGTGVRIADTDTQITDADSPNMTGGFVTLTNAQTGDALQVNGVTVTNGDSGTIGAVNYVVNATGSQIIMALSGNATQAEYETAIEAIGFVNPLASPSLVDRIFNTTITDGTTTSPVAVTTITMAPSSLTPVVDLDGDDSSLATGADYNTGFTAGGTGVRIADTDTQITDADSPNMTGGFVTLTNAQTGDALQVNGVTVTVGDSGTIGAVNYTINATGSQIIVALSGNATQAEYETAIEAIGFINPLASPSLVDRIFNTTITDGTTTSPVAVTTITMAPGATTPAIDLDGDDSSLATGADYNTGFTAGGPGVRIADTDTQITDADSPNMTGGFVTLTNAQTGDALQINGVTVTNGDSGTIGPVNYTINATGSQIIVALSGNATQAEYETAIKAIGFTNTQASPSLVDRIFNTTITDGTTTSPVAVTTITMAQGVGPGIDTDGDGVDDSIDVDDDNDGILDVDEGVTVGPNIFNNSDFDQADVDEINSGSAFLTAADNTTLYRDHVEFLGGWNTTDTVDWSEGQYINASNPNANVDTPAIIDPSPAGGGFAIFSVDGEGLDYDIPVTSGEIYVVEFYVGLLPEYSNVGSGGTANGYAPDLDWAITAGGEALAGGPVSFSEADLPQQYLPGDFPSNINPASPATFVKLDPNWQRVSFAFRATGSTATFDIRANTNLAIVTLDDFTVSQVLSGGIDSDQDGLFDHLDIDKDNDGITDNVEAQTTAGYIAPSGVGSAMIDTNNDGLDDNYDAGTAAGAISGATGYGLTPVNSDGTDLADVLDADSDNDGVNDVDEAGHGVTQLAIDTSPDTDADGLKDVVEGADNNDGFDVNDENIAGDDGGADGAYANFSLNDTDSDTNANEAVANRTTNDAIVLASDLDYRDNTIAGTVPPALDLDADNSSLATGANYDTTFTVGGSAVTIADTDTQITDADSPNMTGGSVILTNRLAGDTLQVNGVGVSDGDSGTIGPVSYSVSVSGGQITITLSGNTTQAAYEAAIKAIRFVNTQAAPSLVDRILHTTVTDGTTTSPIAVTRISMATNIVPGIDTDGDGVDDTIDIDDDNDGILDIDEGAVQTVVPGSTMAFEKSDVDPPPPSFDTAVDGITEYANSVDYAGTWDVTGTVDWSEGQYIVASDPNANINLKAMIEPSSPAGGGFAIFSIPGEGLINTMPVSVGEIYTVEFYVGTLPQYDDSTSTGILTVYSPDFTYGITSGGQAVGGGAINFDQSDLANQYTVADFPADINPVNPAAFVELDPHWQKVSFTFQATANTARFEIATGSGDAAILVDGFSTTQISSVTGIDSDQDGIFDHLDIDKDNDGITDNVEAQATATYIAPSGTATAMTDIDGDGLDDNYDADTGNTTSAASVGLAEVDTDGDNTPDTLDPDSDNDGLNDVDEAGHGVTQATINGSPDTDGDGLKDAVEGADNNDGFDVNDENLDVANINFLLADSDSDTAATGANAIPLVADFDFRDILVPVVSPPLPVPTDDTPGPFGGGSDPDIAPIEPFMTLDVPDDLIIIEAVNGLEKLGQGASDLRADHELVIIEAVNTLRPLSGISDIYGSDRPVGGEVNRIHDMRLNVDAPMQNLVEDRAGLDRNVPANRYQLSEYPVAMGTLVADNRAESDAASRERPDVAMQLRSRIADDALIIELREKGRDGVQDRVRDYRVLLADGRPLPGWMRYTSDGLIIIDKAGTINGPLDIQVMFVVDGEQIVAQLMTVDPMAGQIVRIGEPQLQAATLLSDQLKNEDRVPR